MHVDPSTLSQLVISATSLGALYALVALGVALVFGIMGLINFAYGELITIGVYTLSWGFLGGKAWPILVFVVVVVVVIIALLQERVAFRPLRNADPTTLMIASFALSYLLQNAALMLGGARPVGVSTPLSAAPQYSVGGVQIGGADIATIVVTAILIVGLTVFLKKTEFGIQMRAAAEDFQMARHLGVRANNVIAAAFGISGVLAAAVAFFLATTTGNVAPTSGVSLLLIAFLATVLGGLGSLVGAAIGAFILAYLEIGVQILLPPDIAGWHDAIGFSVVLAILLFRPQGLVPTARRGERT